jgi:DNA-binding MarR family transcriptional regulator
MEAVVGMVRESQTAIEDRLLFDFTLTMGARLTWMMLSQYARLGEAVCRRDLALWLDCSEPTVRRYVNELVSRGLVEQERRGLGKPNAYRIFGSERMVEL